MKIIHYLSKVKLLVILRAIIMSNIVKGTVLKFEEAIFNGSWKKPKFSHTAIHTVKVTKESYGSSKGQHSFTLEVIDSTERKVGETFRKMGRNIYPTAQIISQPETIIELTEEKNERSQEAKETKYFNWLMEAQYEGKKWKIEKIPMWFKIKYREHFENIVYV